MKSGNPGYIVGNRLMVARLENNFLLLKKYGFFVIGKDKNGACLNTGNFINSFDFALNFGENVHYTCQQKFATQNDFNNFCTNQLWKNLKIYTMANDLQYIGRFGNPSPANPNDFYQVLQEQNSFSSFSFTNNVCNFPSTIVVDILYAKGGLTANPQKYVASARISAVNSNHSFNSAKPYVDISFVVNYIDLDAVRYDKPIPNESILPRLPSDIADPFVKG